VTLQSPGSPPSWRISIHTALAGCDINELDLELYTDRFQSTQPSQAVTHCGGDGPLVPGISIHTALAGCDGPKITKITDGLQISIHTALAGCDAFSPVKPIASREFQSTQPSQAVTSIQIMNRVILIFQSTQPSQAVTDNRNFKSFPEHVFQSTQPSQAVT